MPRSCYPAFLDSDWPANQIEAIWKENAKLSSIVYMICAGMGHVSKGHLGS